MYIINGLQHLYVYSRRFSTSICIFQMFYNVNMHILDCLYHQYVYHKLFTTYICIFYTVYSIIIIFQTVYNIDMYILDGLQHRCVYSRLFTILICSDLLLTLLQSSQFKFITDLIISGKFFVQLFILKFFIHSI